MTITREQIVEIMRNELIVEYNTTIIKGYEDAANAIMDLIEQQNATIALMKEGLNELSLMPLSYAFRGLARSILRVANNNSVEPCPTCGSVFVSRNEDLEEKYRFCCYSCTNREREKEQEAEQILWDQESAERHSVIEQLKECWPELEWWNDVEGAFWRFKSAKGVERRLDTLLPKRDNSKLADMIYRGVQQKWIPPTPDPQSPDPQSA